MGFKTYVSDKWNATKQLGSRTNERLGGWANFIDDKWRNSWQPWVEKAIGTENMDAAAETAGSFVEDRTKGTGKAITKTVKALSPYLPDRFGGKFLKEKFLELGEYMTTAGDRTRKYISPNYETRKPPTDSKKPPTDSKKPPTDSKKPPNDPSVGVVASLKTSVPKPPDIKMDFDSTSNRPKNKSGVISFGVNRQPVLNLAPTMPQNARNPKLSAPIRASIRSLKARSGRLKLQAIEWDGWRGVPSIYGGNRG